MPEPTATDDAAQPAAGTSGADRPAPPPHPGRSLLAACVVGAVVVWVLFVLVISYGTGDLVHRETFGGFYDAQAEALLDGNLAVDPDAVRFEGFRMDDGTFMYQGLVPALVRVPVLAVTDSYEGRLTGLSMAIAFAVALAAAVRVTLRTRRLVRGDDPVGRAEAVRTGFLVLGLGGSTLLFLAAKAWIYHEALLWGAALALVSLAFLLDWVGDDRRRLRWLVGAGVFGVAAVHTRFSTGMGAVAALGLVAGALVIGALLRGRRDGWFRVLGLSAAGPVGRLGAPIAVLGVSTVLALGSYAAVNQARFGTSFSIPIDRQVLVGFDEQFQRALDDNGGSLFGLRYSPSQALQLVRPDALSLSPTFPFVAFPDRAPTVVGDVEFAELDWSSSLPLSEPLLVLGALAGLVAVFVPRRTTRRTDAGALRLPVLGSLVAVGGFGVIGYIAFRYQADLWPTLALLAPVGVHAVGARADRSRPGRRVLAVGVAALALWGVWVNASLAVEYQRVIAPGAWEDSRADWLATQDRFGAAPATRTIGAVEPLPPAGPRGQVLVVGDCAALYRSNGDLWYLLEGGQATGSFRGTLDVERVPTGADVLLRGVGDAGATEVAIEGRPDGRVRFVVVSSSADPAVAPAEVTGPWFDVEVGDELDVRTEVDWRTGFVEVRGGDRELLSANAPLVEVPALEVVDSGDVVPDLRVPSGELCRSLRRD